MKYSVLEMLDKVISFNTESANSNMELMNFITEYLTAHGVKSYLVHGKDDKAALYATIGPNIDGGIILSGHTDVVPVKGQDWFSNPYKLVIKEGKAYGRGTSDMKGFISAVLSMVPEMVAANLKKPIHLALTFDEEVTFAGAHILCKEMAAKLPKCAMAIIGEPTGMKVISSNKGCAVIKTTITGKEAHSSQVGKGVSAVMTAGTLIEFINKELQVRMENPVMNSPLEPPVSTLHVGTITGGTATNIMAKNCEFFWSIRSMPGDSAQPFLKKFREFCDNELLPKMKSISTECDIKTTVLLDAPSLAADMNGDAVSVVCGILNDKDVLAVSYATEAGIFQEYKTPALICGPGYIDQAHKPNEFIEVEQLDQCCDFLMKFISYLSK